jgi:CTP:molybdopterin cytidylyltransferase MocA
VEGLDRGRVEDLIAGLILAAGEGTRFGPEPKLLAPLAGRPLLEHAIRAQSAVPELERVVVVLGAHADALLTGVDFGRAEPVVCERWRDGQATSLRRGLEELQAMSRVIVTLGDEPLITPAIVARFVGEAPGTRAVYNGRPGHPVVLGREEIHRTTSLIGDEGARGLLRDGPTIELGGCRDLGRDVDTSEDLERMRNEARAVV